MEWKTSGRWHLSFLGAAMVAAVTTAIILYQHPIGASPPWLSAHHDAVFVAFGVVVVLEAALFIWWAASLPSLAVSRFRWFVHVNYWLESTPTRRLYALGLCRNALLQMATLSLLGCTVALYLLVTARPLLMWAWLGAVYLILVTVSSLWYCGSLGEAKSWISPQRTD
jgi:hypothetical protein